MSVAEVLIPHTLANDASLVSYYGSSDTHKVSGLWLWHACHSHFRPSEYRITNATLKVVPSQLQGLFGFRPFGLPEGTERCNEFRYIKVLPVN